MSDRALAAPFLTTPQGRAPLGDGAWPVVPRRRLTPPRPRSLWPMLVLFWRRHRTRAAIAQLDAHLLKDIGITYAEAENEANKPFWLA